MRRFAPSQPDLFSADDPQPAPPVRDPVGELSAVLVWLQAADRLPWPDAVGAMAEEHRVLGLARTAGAEGESLAAAILQETERLLAGTE